jgi:hypothetical protein
MMHRRSYMPHDGAKLSRAQLARVNAKLRKDVEARDEFIRAQREEQQRRNREREATGIRGFLNKARRILNTPIRLSRRTP